MSKDTKGKSKKAKPSSISSHKRAKIIAEWKSGDFNTQRQLLNTGICSGLNKVDLSRILQGSTKGANARIVKAGADFQAGIQAMPKLELKQVVGAVEYQAKIAPLRIKIESAASALVDLIEHTVKKAMPVKNTNPSKEDKLTMLDIKNAMEALDKGLIIINEAPRHAPKAIIDNRTQTLIDAKGEPIPELETLSKEQICEYVGDALPN